MAIKKGYRSWADIKACFESGGESGCCPEFQTNSLVNDLQEILNLVDSDSIEVEYLLDGSVTFHVTGDSGSFDLTLAPIGNTPNANAATLNVDQLNLEPADVNFGGIVTASDTPQRFHGQKEIESSTSLFLGWSDNLIPGSWVKRTELFPSGLQVWYVNNGLAECGSIWYSTPNSFPGISFFNPGFTGRSQIRQYTTSGGISLGSINGPVGAIPDNQLVVLPNSHTFITGFITDVSPTAATPVTDRGYMFDVSGSAIIDGKLNLGTSSDFADNAAALLGGLVVGDVYRTNDFLKIVH